jgi:hypothetical protein
MNFQLSLSAFRRPHLVQAQARSIRMPGVPPLMRRMFPRGYPGRKPELSFDLNPKSEGPFQPPSCLLWVPSEVLSIEQEDIEQ